MEQVIINGAAVGALVTLLCTASITKRLRNVVRRRTKVLDCAYCTSFWVTLLVDFSSTYLATVTFANIAVMLIHWSLATYEQQEDQT